MNIIRTKFLLADDDTDDWGLFCEALASVSPVIQCLTVENGIDLFKRLIDEIRKPDIIFLDINMPVMNGWECIKKLKADPDHKDIPVVIYSTSSAKKDISNAYDLGASIFLSKPDSFNVLQEILRIMALAPQSELTNRLSQFSNVKLPSNQSSS